MISISSISFNENENEPETKTNSTKTKHKFNEKRSQETMKIYVQTLSFGAITLKSVEPSMTIVAMKKMTCRKIDNEFTGYDIELALGAERGAVYTFKSQELEDGCCLSDYNIQNESTIRATFGLLGGGTYVSFCFISFHFLFSFGNAIF